MHHSLDVPCRPEDGTAKGSALEGCGMEMVKDDLLQIGLYLLHLAQNDATLTLNFLLPQQAVLDDV